jgi:tyrosine-protein phosphatase SIW14
MPRFLSIVFGWLIAILLVGGPLWYWSYHNHCFRNFHVVEEGVLYRSAQLNLAGLQRLIHDYGIKTVVSLRDGEKSNDIDEEHYLNTETEIKFVRIPPRPWHADDGSVPAEASVQEFREVMADPSNYPVLVHCYAGIHRTGALCAIRRIDHDGWTNAEAIKEMFNLGYTAQHLDVLPYLRNYKPQSLPSADSSIIRPASQQKVHAP